jgi:hypothetical protein
MLKVTLLFGALQALPMASRNVPAPLSAVLVTTGLVVHGITT